MIFLKKYLDIPNGCDRLRVEFGVVPIITRQETHDAEDCEESKEKIVREE